MRALRRSVIVVLVLAALFVATDRVAAWVASRAVADQVGNQLGGYDIQSTPDADIGGFPFLTQVASGTYEEVTVRIAEADVEQLSLRDIELVATSVDAPMAALIAGSGQVLAEQLAGTGVVDYASLAARTGLNGLELSAGDGDSVDVRLPTDVLGRSIVLVGTGVIDVTDGAIVFRVEELTPEDSEELPPEAMVVLERLAGSPPITLPIPPLPYDLTVESAEPTDDGLAVALSAPDVVLID